MASLLRNAACPTCGKRHTYCLDQGSVQTGQEYECFCPEQGTLATMTAPTAGDTVTFPPQGAIALIFKSWASSSRQAA